MIARAYPDSGRRSGSRILLQQARELDRERTLRIEGADVLDVTPVTRGAVIGHHDAVERGLVGAVAREANVNSHESSEKSKPLRKGRHGSTGRAFRQAG